jgi:glycosyltransferase involved in cell wall biosynthesis
MERREGRHRLDPSGQDAVSWPKGATAANLDDRGRSERGLSPEIKADGVMILIPVFNDWESLSQLLPRLDAALAPHFLTVDVLIVDDGSTVEYDALMTGQPYVALGRIDVLRLRRNLGHQRAIAIGLAYIEDRCRAGAVVIMDGDGEDDPRDVPRLLNRLQKSESPTIVFAERARRSESLVFRVFYALFKLLHRILTGHGVRVGNFSVVPQERLSSLVVVDDLWNHYAAAVIRSRQPFAMIPTERSHRFSGRSTMNFVSLVTHGLSAISVYSDIVGVRLLVASIALAVLAFVGMITAVMVRFATNLAIPGWASYTVGILLILFVQAVLGAFVFSFAILGSRRGTTFLPRRDYSFFIGPISTLFDTRQSRTSMPHSEHESAVIIQGK